MGGVNAISGMGSGKDHVAIVRSGKNRLKHTLRKEDEGETGMANPEVVKLVKESVAPSIDEAVLETAFAGLNEADAKAMQDGLEGLVSEKNTLTKAVADADVALKAANDKMAGMIPDPAKKATIKMEDLPEEVRVVLKKAEEDRVALAEERKIRLTKEATEEVAKDFGSLTGAPQEAFVDAILEARATLTKESAKTLEDVLRGSSAAIKESGLFGELGSANAVAGTKNEQVHAMAEKLVKEDTTGKLTPEAARVQVIRQHPELYDTK